jgi:hypothetical protein
MVKLKRLLPSNNGTNCLGKLSLERGHKRVPDPPQRIIGLILQVIFVFYMH